MIDYDLWLEFDGMMLFRPKPEMFQEKLNYYQENGFNYFVLQFDNWRSILMEKLDIDSHKN